MGTFLTVSLLLLVGVLLAIRIRIFRAMGADQEAQELLEEHFIIQHDILFWKLWRIRDKVEAGHRWQISAYFWLNVVPIAAGLVGLVVHWAL
ncbi:MAG: hypothetical protein J7507_14535 [Pseudoxanthomonas sp.]|nr:hypothetical protein [Pseudoxanthomonas sp.]